MIRINKYKVCRITGETDVDATSFNPEEVKMLKSFTSEEEAVEWIEEMQGTQLATNFILWVSHKQHIAAASNWYSGEDRKNAIVAAVLLTHRVISLPLFSLCSDVLQLKSDLYKILPAPGNASFLSSKQHLDEMIRFCKEKMKKVQLKKVS